MSICNKTSNNKYFNCPARMSDGRQFTDYRPNCYVNNLLRYNNKTMSSYEYRQFLINNGSELMNINNQYISQQVGCEPCNAPVIKNQSECVYNRQSGSCRINDVNGIGLKNSAVPESQLHIAPYNPGLQEYEEINIGALNES